MPLTCLLVLTLAPGVDSTEIRLGAGNKTIEVTDLAKPELDALAKWKATPEEWASLFALYVDKGERKDQLPVLGTYRIEKDILCFEPRFPLIPGLRYRVDFDPTKLPSKPEGKVRSLSFAIPKPKAGPPAFVEQVYPTSDKLPENQLKFYIHFSASMSRGEAYRNIRLLDDKGKVVDKVFVEIDEELWDDTLRRFTIYFDPGRIKRGLKPREDLGPTLMEGKRYTLEIDRRFCDGEGNPLKETFRKSFSVLAPDDTQPDPRKWKLEAPAGESRTPLVVTFPKPLDHALLNRMLWVVDARGTKIPGTITVTKGETHWAFTPEKPWAAGSYKLVADKRLEDLAGNSIARPFEVDVFRPVTREIKTETVTLPFEVKSRR